MSTLTEALADALNAKTPGQTRVFTPGDNTSLGDRIRAASAAQVLSGPHPSDIDDARSIRRQLDEAYSEITEAKRLLQNARQQCARLILDKQDLDAIIAESVLSVSN